MQKWLSVSCCFSLMLRDCVSTEEPLEWIPLIEQSLVALMQREGKISGALGIQSFPNLIKKLRTALQFSFARDRPALPGALQADVQLTRVLFFVTCKSRVPLTVVF